MKPLAPVTSTRMSRAYPDEPRRALHLERGPASALHQLLQPLPAVADDRTAVGQQQVIEVQLRQQARSRPSAGRAWSPAGRPSASPGRSRAAPPARAGPPRTTPSASTTARCPGRCRAVSSGQIASSSQATTPPGSRSPISKPSTGCALGELVQAGAVAVHRAPEALDEAARTPGSGGGWRAGSPGRAGPLGEPVETLPRRHERIDQDARLIQPVGGHLDVDLRMSGRPVADARAAPPAWANTTGFSRRYAPPGGAVDDRRHLRAEALAAEAPRVLAHRPLLERQPLEALDRRAPAPAGSARRTAPPWSRRGPSPRRRPRRRRSPAPLPPAPRRARSRSPPRPGTAAPVRLRRAARRARARETLPRNSDCPARPRPARPRAPGPSPATFSRRPSSGAGGHREIDPLVGDDPPEGEVVVARGRALEPEEVLDVDGRVDDLGRAPVVARDPLGHVARVGHEHVGPGGARQVLAAQPREQRRQQQPRHPAHLLARRGSPPPRRSASACGSSRRAASRPARARSSRRRGCSRARGRSRRGRTTGRPGSSAAAASGSGAWRRACGSERGVHGPLGDLRRPGRGVVDRGEQLGLGEHLQQLEHHLLGAAGDRQPVVHDRHAREAPAQLLEQPARWPVWPPAAPPRDYTPRRLGSWRRDARSPRPARTRHRLRRLRRLGHRAVDQPAPPDVPPGRATTESCSSSRWACASPSSPAAT